MQVKDAIELTEEMIKDIIDPYLIDDPSWAAKRVKKLHSYKAALQLLIKEATNGN